MGPSMLRSLATLPTRAENHLDLLGDNPDRLDGAKCCIDHSAFTNDHLIDDELSSHLGRVYYGILPAAKDDIVTN
ncbi:unnamed protein product [Clonostachys rhizophaga]|uniref:Uncharacterized protein n=1 Tax=Clonostachys rhizophaga TaxID=160324 RepID=A0A9N9YJE6_9HYPO|nr:unnamed protein product [Clonostachys rhizophaga]